VSYDEVSAASAESAVDEMEYRKRRTVSPACAADKGLQLFLNATAFIMNGPQLPETKSTRDMHTPALYSFVSRSCDNSK